MQLAASQGIDVLTHDLARAAEGDMSLCVAEEDDVVDNVGIILAENRKVDSAMRTHVSNLSAKLWRRMVLMKYLVGLPDDSRLCLLYALRLGNEEDARPISLARVGSWCVRGAAYCFRQRSMTQPGERASAPDR